MKAKVTEVEVCPIHSIDLEDSYCDRCQLYWGKCELPVTAVNIFSAIDNDSILFTADKPAPFKDKTFNIK